MCLYLSSALALSQKNYLKNLNGEFLSPSAILILENCHLFIKSALCLKKRKKLYGASSYGPTFLCSSSCFMHLPQSNQIE